MTKLVKDIHQYECANCGSTLEFDGECGNLKCVHCGSVREIVRDHTVVERDFVELVDHSKWSDSNVASYRCSNCGATTMFTATAIATRCPYCSSPVVLDDSAIQSVRPDTTIPFNIGKDRAKSAMLAWRKKRFWAPRSFQNSKSVEGMVSTYSPVWTFDSDTTTHYRGTVGYRRTRTVTVNGKKTTETYIEWKDISGVLDRIFDDIMVRGSDNVPERYFGGLLPYPQQFYVGYNDDYLAGHSADNYTVPPQDAYNSAVECMKNVVRQDIINRYNADVVGELDMDMRYNSRSFKYVMAPVYIANSMYKDKQYSTYVSGIAVNDKIKISGPTPVSAIKVILAVLISLIVIVGTALLLDYNGAIDLGIFANITSINTQPIACMQYGQPTGNITPCIFS